MYSLKIYYQFGRSLTKKKLGLETLEMYIFDTGNDIKSDTMPNIHTIWNIRVVWDSPDLTPRVKEMFKKKKIFCFKHCFLYLFSQICNLYLPYNFIPFLVQSWTTT